jgi:hypothetical protein
VRTASYAQEREILAKAASFAARWESSPGGPFWATGVAEWRLRNDQDLFARLMIPDSALGPERTERWGPTMGWVEAGLHSELQRRWLLWRDELLAGHEREHESLADGLLARQHRWEMEPHARLGGASPFEAILCERREARRSKRKEK